MSDSIQTLRTICEGKCVFPSGARVLAEQFKHGAAHRSNVNDEKSNQALAQSLLASFWATPDERETQIALGVAGRFNLWDTPVHFFDENGKRGYETTFLEGVMGILAFRHNNFTGLTRAWGNQPLLDGKKRTYEKTWDIIDAAYDGRLETIKSFTNSFGQLAEGDAGMRALQSPAFQDWLKGLETGSGILIWLMQEILKDGATEKDIAFIQGVKNIVGREKALAWVLNVSSYTLFPVYTKKYPDGRTEKWLEVLDMLEGRDEGINQHKDHIQKWMANDACESHAYKPFFNDERFDWSGWEQYFIESLLSSYPWERFEDLDDKRALLMEYEHKWEELRQAQIVRNIPFPSLADFIVEEHHSSWRERMDTLCLRHDMTEKYHGNTSKKTSKL